jgi:hypothetical protein
MARWDRADWHAAGAHKVAEKPPRLIATLMSFSFESAIHFGRNRKTHLAAEDDRIFGRKTVQSDNVTIKALCHFHRGFEYRGRIPVPDHS